MGGWIWIQTHLSLTSESALLTITHTNISLKKGTHYSLFIIHYSLNIIYRAFNSYYCHEDGAMPTLVMTKLRSRCGLMRSRSHDQGLAEIRLGLLALNLSKAFPTTSGCTGHSLKAPQPPPQAVQVIASRPLSGGGESCPVLGSFWQALHGPYRWTLGSEDETLTLGWAYNTGSHGFTACTLC